MKLKSIEAVIKALDGAGVKYLVAGGLAVVAHGYMRFTADLDIILRLEKSNLTKALGILKGLGYRPRAPVPIEAFAAESNRKSWVREKGLKVFSLWSDKHKTTEIDVFVEEPVDFGKAYLRRKRLSVAPGIQASILSLEDLIKLKKAAGRPKDMEDVKNLLIIKEDQKNG